MTHVTYRLTAKNQDQLRNPTFGNRVWATFLPGVCNHSRTLAGRMMESGEWATRIDAAYCYRCSVVSLSPCPSLSVNRLRCRLGCWLGWTRITQERRHVWGLGDHTWAMGMSRLACSRYTQPYSLRGRSGVASEPVNQQILNLLACLNAVRS